jgi:LacI family transcriptional regulator
MSVTIHDVAEEASVSATTVSRVFNHDHLVKPDTRERVLQAARRMGYTPNAAAQSLSSGRTRSIGVILPAPHGEFFSELIRGLDEAAQESNHYLLIASSHYKQEEGASALSSLVGRVDGLIIMTPRVQSGALTANIDLDMPTVFINTERGDTMADLFSLENREGAERVVEHLIERGHRRIGVITGPIGSRDVEDRMAGYRAAIRAHDLEGGPVVEGTFTQESGYEAGKTIAGFDDPPDAIFACNDYMAIGAMAALQEAGFEVPGDIAVAGFDDIASARFASPSLTTVHIPIYEIGRRAGARLIERIRSDAPFEPQEFTLPHELKVRDSTGG